MNQHNRGYCRHEPCLHRNASISTIPSVLLLSVMMLFVTTSTNAQLFSSANEEENRVQISLVPSSSSLYHNEGVVWIALHMDILDGWHVYWRNPGDAGLPTEIRWQEYPGLEPGEIHWPVPSRFDEDGITTYGYSDEVLLPVPVRFTEASSQSSDNTVLSVQANWLVCKDICIPESGSAELRLNSEGVFTDYDASASARVHHTLEHLPAAADGWDATGTIDGTSIRVVMTPPEDTNLPLDPSTLYFYAYDGSILEHTAPQQMRLDGRNMELILPTSRYMPSQTDRLEGILVAEPAREGSTAVQALEFDIPLSRN